MKKILAIAAFTLLFASSCTDSSKTDKPQTTRPADCTWWTDAGMDTYWLSIEMDSVVNSLDGMTICGDGWIHDIKQVGDSIVVYFELVDKSLNFAKVRLSCTERQSSQIRRVYRDSAYGLLSVFFTRRFNFRFSVTSYTGPEFSINMDINDEYPYESTLKIDAEPKRIFVGTLMSFEVILPKDR